MEAWSKASEMAVCRMEMGAVCARGLSSGRRSTSEENLILIWQRKLLVPIDVVRPEASLAYYSIDRRLARRRRRRWLSLFFFWGCGGGGGCCGVIVWCDRGIVRPCSTYVRRVIGRSVMDRGRQIDRRRSRSSQLLRFMRFGSSHAKLN